MFHLPERKTSKPLKIMTIIQNPRVKYAVYGWNLDMNGRLLSCTPLHICAFRNRRKATQTEPQVKRLATVIIFAN